MFEVLTYTDSAAGESVSGRSGFQFRAESAGATPTDEHRISSGLLHVVPVRLDPERPDTHPPTCAYAAIDGRYYLARGRSTGRTLSGRPGNQFTRTIVTGAAGDILPLRPAQLFSAAPWAADPPPGARIPGWQAPLEIAPDFEVAGLHAMVTTDPWARDLLPRFLTMVEQATAERRVKLIIAHPEQDVVMRWIALASLFQDGERALQSSFRVYSANPVGDAAHIVGAHPLLSPDLTPAGVAGCNLVDLDRRVATPVAVSPSAAEHAAWFQEQDPYEALDAVETSRRWGEFLEPGPAALAASVACLDGEERATSQAGLDAVLAALGALADARRHDELEAYGEALVDAVVARRPQDGDDIGRLATALWQLRAAEEEGLATGLALAGLEWAARQPAAARAWCTVHDPAEGRVLGWADAAAAAHAAGLVGQVLSQAPDEELAGWFALGRSLGAEPAAEQIGEHVRRLARRWAAQPELAESAGSWMHADRVTLALEEELVARFAAGDGVALAALHAGTWDRLADGTFVVDPSGRPLSVWLAARTRGAASREEWVETVRRVAPFLPDHAGDLYLGPAAGPITAEEVAAWLDRPRQLTPGLAQQVERLVGECIWQGRPEPLRRLAGVLTTDVTGIPREVAGLLADCHRVTVVVEEAREQVRRPENAALRELATYPMPWPALHAHDLAEILLSTVDDDAIVALSNAAGRTLDAALEQAVTRLAGAADDRALTGTLDLLAVDPDGLGRPAQAALSRFWSDPQQASARARLTEAASPALLEDAEASLQTNWRGRPKRPARRAARGRR